VQTSVSFNSETTTQQGSEGSISIDSVKGGMARAFAALVNTGLFVRFGQLPLDSEETFGLTVPNAKNWLIKHRKNGFASVKRVMAPGVRPEDGLPMRLFVSGENLIFPGGYNGLYGSNVAERVIAALRKHDFLGGLNPFPDFFRYEEIVRTDEFLRF